MPASLVRVVLVPGLGLDDRSLTRVVTGVRGRVAATVVRLPGMGLPEPVPPLEIRGTRDQLCPHDWAAGVVAAAPRGGWSSCPAPRT